VFAQAADKSDSRFNGVQIGAITYSYSGMPSTTDDLLDYLVRSGLSSAELMGEPAEQSAFRQMISSTKQLLGTRSAVLLQKWSGTVEIYFRE